jgi:hypothetical protein
LRDPADWLTGPHAPVPLAALQRWRSLALLGEPGIGKSTTLKEEADRVAMLPEAASLASIYVDLRAFSSESLLYQRVFESEKFTAWKTGSSHLFLHIDSLDEALLRIDSIANLFASELSGLPTDRLSIRIACRTAVWPAETLGVSLKNNQSRHDELAAGVERIGAARNVRLDYRNAAVGDRHVRHHVDAERRIDDAPALDDEIKACRARI